MYNLLRILGDRHAGFILGMAVVANLIAGSLVMDNHPELYPRFFHLDLNYFFRPVRSEHSWLYALLLTFSLFGVNLLACSIDSFIRLLNNKAGRLKASAALLFHVALLITMVAHLIEGFYASTQKTQITVQGVELPVLGKVRVESLKNIYYPDNSLKDTEVTLLFSKPDGQRISRDIAFNEPADFDMGRRQVVMLGGQKMLIGVVIARDADKQEFRLEANKLLPLAGGRLLLQGFLKTGTDLPYAQFLWQSDNGNRQQHIMVLSANAPHSQINIDGALYRFSNAIEAPFIDAIVRYNPSIPLMLVSLMLAAAATFLLTRWLGVRSRMQLQKGFSE